MKPSTSLELFLESGSRLLTSTPSRSHRSKTRSIAVALLVVVVLAVLAGAGYAVTRANKSPAVAKTSPPVTTTSTAAPTSAPASLPPADDVVAFLALPIGSPPTAGTGDHHYPWYRLTASLHGPHSAAAGSTAQFTVRLSNPTSVPVALSPCPAFDLTVGYQTTSYGLNCLGAANDVIKPGGSLTFALTVPISHSLGVGTTADVAWSLGWQPDAHSPHSHQALRVTG